MKIFFIFISSFLSISIIAQTTNFIDIKLKDTSKIKISGRTTVIGNTNNVSSVNSNGYSNNYDKILLSIESGDPSISGQSVGGFLTPRMTTSQRNTIFNSITLNGTLIYNTTSNAFEYYNTGSNSWVPLGAGGADPWSSLELNGVHVFNPKIGKVGIGTNTPKRTLDVNGTMYVNDTFTTLGLNNFNNTVTLANGNLNINNGTLNVSNSINVASSKFTVDNLGNVANTGNITASNNITSGGGITDNNDITTPTNVNFGGKLVSKKNQFNLTYLSSDQLPPVTFNFTSNGGTIFVTYSGTMGVQNTNRQIGLNIKFDNSTTTDNLVLFVTSFDIFTLPTRTIMYSNVAAGNHSIEINYNSSDAKLVSSTLGFMNVSILELPF